MKRIIYTTGVLLLIGAGVFGYWAYGAIYTDNIQDNRQGYHDLYISTDWNYDSLNTQLLPMLIEPLTFSKLANQMNLPNKVIPGYYRINNNMSNLGLIRKLRSGSSEQIKVLLRGSSDRSDILVELGNKLQPDSADFQKYVDSLTFLNEMGYTLEDWPCMMMANTFYFNWATTTYQVFERFIEEKKKFWNSNRRVLLQRSGLETNEVLILASIVDAETMRDSELERIAGVYLNRLQKNWPLQADPTIRYFVNSEGRQRVLNSDLKQEHPYNTYLNLGLPPGPILLPSIKAVDAVLNAESHDYMFFCAQDDLSGHHLFTSSLRVHNANARRYHNALNRRNIMR
jgi:peptidoglycan lytic transglycosylase G